MRHSRIRINTGLATVVNLVSDTFTLTDGTLSVTAETEARITPVANAFTLSDGTLTVRPEQETSVNLAGDAFTLSDGILSIGQQQKHLRINQQRYFVAALLKGCHQIK